MASSAVPDYLKRILSENDIDILFEILYDVRVKYELFGLQIGVKCSDIECIIADNPERDSSKRLQEVLKLRLKQSPALTGGDIDKALRSKSVNEPRLAESMLEKLRSGKICLVPQPVSESSSSDESSSSSDDCLRNISETECKRLRKIFQKFFGKMCTTIKEPADVAAELQERGLIKSSLMEEILISQESNQAKTITLVKYLQKRIDKHPEKLLRIVELFLHIEHLQDIGRKMKHAAETISTDNISAPSNNPHSSPTHFNSETQTNSDHPPLHHCNQTSEKEHRKNQDPTQQCTTRGSQSSELVSGSVPESILSPELERYRQYLQSVYRARKLAAADKYVPTLDSPYINLAIIDRHLLNQERRDKFTEQTLHGGVDQIIASKTPINIEDLLVFENQPPTEKGGFVMVEGPPGIGKSTFAWEICRRWSEIESLRKFLIILLLKLREKWVLNATSLAHLFRFPADPELSRKIAQLLNDCLLLILDGFDEVSHSFHDDSIIKSILCRQLLPECTIILTTRPSAKHTLQSVCQPRVDKHVEIIGFTEEERVRYIIEVLGNKPELQANFLKYMFLVPHIKSMIYIPLNCAIIAQVYYESQSSRHLAIPKTRTQLYAALTHSLLVRHMKTREGSREHTGMLPEAFNVEDMENFTVLAKFAFDSYHQKGARKVTFYNDIPEGLVHFGFMSESCEMYAGQRVEKNFSFLHLSLQEYLAAWYITQNYSTRFQVDYHKLALQAIQPCNLESNDSESVDIFVGSECLLVSCCTTDEEEVLLQSIEPLQESLVEPALFLAGITGWRCQSDDVRNLWETYLYSTSCFENTNLLVTSLYEAQNKRIISHYFISQERKDITIGYKYQVNSQTAYDSYTLSYCLANSSNRFNLCVDDSDVSLVETFVKGIDDHCKYIIPAVKNLKLDFHSYSVDTIKRCFFWLSKVKFSGAVKRIELKYNVTELPLFNEFLLSHYNLESITISRPNCDLYKLERRTKLCAMVWLPALQSLTRLKFLEINLPKDECIPPSSYKIDCKPVYWIKEIILEAILPSSTVYVMCSLTDKMIRSLLNIALRSYHNLNRIELPNISRETMRGTRSILLHCPNLESLKLRKTRLGYDGILFICSALRHNTTIKHLTINDDPFLPPPPLYGNGISFKLEVTVPLPSKTTCTEFILELNSILQINTTLNEMDIKSGLFLPLPRMLHLFEIEQYSQWTGCGPFQKFNTGAVASGISHNLRKSYSTSDITKPQQMELEELGTCLNTEDIANCREQD